MLLLHICRLNSSRTSVMKPRFGIGKSVSKNFRSFHKVSTQRIDQLKIKTIKKRSETKMWWAVRAYQQWRSNRVMDTENLNIDILMPILMYCVM